MVRRYFVTPGAADALENDPQVLLYNRLNDRTEGRAFVYRVNGRPVCAILTQTSRCVIENVQISTPGEITDGIPRVSVEFKENYVAPFLPYDLDLVKTSFENELKGRELGYRSEAHPQAICMGSNPFDIYGALHLFSKYQGKMLARIRRMVEVGAWLATMSFLISQYLSRSAKVIAADIDPRSTDKAEKMGRVMQRKFGYDLSRVKHRTLDVFDRRKINFRDFDAAMGWFPIARGISDETQLELLRELGPGALFFHFCNGHPLSVHEDKIDNIARGFREVAYHSPIVLFERA